MKINRISRGDTLTLEVSGRLDTMTAPMLDRELEDLIGVNTLIIDFAELEYISSAGLRVLLSAHKRMSREGRMIVKNTNEMINEVFELTGFCDILTIE